MNISIERALPVAALLTHHRSIFSNIFTSLKKIYMLKSMTGFGRAERSVGGKTFLVDIKSLNGKQFELQLKLPAF